MALKNVVGLFDNASDAQGALQDLKNAGFSGTDISFVANNSRNEYGDVDTTGRSDTGTEAEEGAGFGATGGAVLGGLTGLLVGLGALAIPGIGPVVAAGTLATALGSTAVGAGIGAAAGGLVGALVGAGVPEEHANLYAEGVRRGGALITVQAGSDEEADRAADIMDRHDVVDIDRRGEEYRAGGFSRFDENTEPYASANTASAASRHDADYGTLRASATAMGSATDYGTTGATHYNTGSTTGATGFNTTNIDQGGEVKVPIVEEELRVGKREVETGGVRVNTRVEEVPVNEQVTIREETIDVHRRPVDRPVSEAELAGFQEGTFEVRERDEEIVVDKQARVVEEVHIKKNVEQRTETVQDTVRRTDVDVQELGGTTRTTGTTGSASNEGFVERTVGNANNAVERNSGLDTDRSGGTGDRDTRNNY